ncbi:YybS family protein [Pseudalkalibacillus sp. SCS-8]|uniref:YybS family protein n=1 Tax=Pseudalkalibacillus nanhaiensis TaxID=3115291 RepID=UPI0032DA64AF
MNRTRALTEGAILASLYAVLFLITLYLPIISTITLFLLSLPFAIYTVRHGFKKSLLLVGTAIVLSIILGSIASINIPILFGSVGVVMGHFYRKKSSSFALLLGTTFAFLANFILIYIVSILFFDINLTTLTKESIEQMIAMTESFGGILGGDVEKSVEQLKGLLVVIPYLLPALFVIMAVIFAFITILINNIFMKKLNIDVPEWKPFREWSFPKSIIWYYLATILIFLSGPEQGSGLYIVTNNLYLILEIILVIQGLAVIYYYFWKKGKGKTIPVLVTILLFILPLGFYVVRILGIIDLGFDLRKRIKA